jgi:FdhE protein
MIGGVAEQVPRPRGARTESRQVQELRELRARQPELSDAVDMHLELLEAERRVLGRVPLPILDVSEAAMLRHQAEGRPVLRFEDIPLDLTDLRLMVRQTADILRRFGAIDANDYHEVQALGRDMKLLEVAAAWYRSVAESHAARLGPGPAPEPAPAPGGMVAQVLAQAMRPFLSRCAEVLQQRAGLSVWTHPHCALCGGEPDLAVITPAADRQLICGRCTLRWKFEALTCPFCRNSERSRITSFATPDGRYRVYACDVCRRYLKAYDARRASRPVMPVVDSVATLPLDAAAIQRGYSG